MNTNMILPIVNAVCVGVLICDLIVSKGQASWGIPVTVIVLACGLLDIYRALHRKALS
jgi:hypothetical protein